MKVIAVLALIAILGAIAFWYLTMRSPGKSFRGGLPPATAYQKELAAALQRDVEVLASIGTRSVYAPETLRAASAHIESSLKQAGYTVARQSYTVDGLTCDNIEVELRGSTRPDEIVIIGAHYDSVDGSPGADDNASGVAGLIAIAREMSKREVSRTVRFVAFVNEEPPHFMTRSMGSYVYATRSHERHENIVAMLSLESLGYYDTRKGSQQYPAPLSKFYPSTGDFIGFVGNVASRRLVEKCVRSFRGHAQFPSESAAMPAAMPGIGWSDQWAFWEYGWPSMMVTDTALFRNPNYHRSSDRSETLDYDRMARVVEGLVGVVRDLASSE